MTKATSWSPVTSSLPALELSARCRTPSPPAWSPPTEWQSITKDSDENSCCALRAPTSPRRVASSGSQAVNVWLTRAALRVRGLPPSARVVLLAHADACPPSGRSCLPGLEELAEACELSPQHVLRLRAQLVAAGHLRKLAAAHPGQRPVYEVLPAVPIPVLSTDRTRERQRVAPSGRTDADNGSHRYDPPYKTRSGSSGPAGR